MSKTVVQLIQEMAALAANMRDFERDGNVWKNAYRKLQAQERELLAQAKVIDNKLIRLLEGWKQ